MSLVKKSNSNWFPSIFDELLASDWMSEKSNLNRIGLNIPAVNIKEEEDRFSLELAIPGKTKEDFSVELDNDVLKISASDKNEKLEENENFNRKEFSYTSFERSFNIPESVEVNQIKADYKEGILKIELPKREEAKVPAKRLIEIA
ncbi:MAG: Hsp20/alpha crystallin family protein [Bacteroidota bacterium]